MNKSFNLPKKRKFHTERLSKRRLIWFYWIHILPAFLLKEISNSPAHGYCILYYMKKYFTGTTTDGWKKHYDFWIRAVRFSFIEYISSFLLRNYVLLYAGRTTGFQKVIHVYNLRCNELVGKTKHSVILPQLLQNGYRLKKKWWLR